MPHNTRYTEPPTRVHLGTATEIEMAIAARHDLLQARRVLIAPEDAAECIRIKEAVNSQYTRVNGLLRKVSQ